MMLLKRTIARRVGYLAHVGWLVVLTLYRRDMISGFTYGAWSWRLKKMSNHFNDWYT